MLAVLQPADTHGLSSKCCAGCQEHHCQNITQASSYHAMYKDLPFLCGVKDHKHKCHARSQIQSLYVGLHVHRDETVRFPGLQ